MARSLQVCLLHLVISWFCITSCRRYRRYPSYLFSSRFRSSFPTYKPMAHCIRLAYGLGGSFTFPDPFLKTKLRRQLINDFDTQKDIKRSFGDMFLTVGELKKALGMDGSRTDSWKSGLTKTDSWKSGLTKTDSWKSGLTKTDSWKSGLTKTDGGDDAFSKTAAAFKANSFQVNSDICCSTNEVFFINQTLLDIDNIPRKIAQLPKIGAYQFIRHGLCAFKGACQGTCVQHYINLPLAVDEPGTAGFPISFRLYRHRMNGYGEISPWYIDEIRSHITRAESSSDKKIYLVYSHV